MQAQRACNKAPGDGTSQGIWAVLLREGYNPPLQEEMDHMMAVGLAIMFLGMIFVASWPHLISTSRWVGGV